ncbi:MAG: hypothetical protein L0154_28950 [Chloroflexi bacterium]|nr:hypothetical protein [Chloroflexota bacterium]
MSISSEDLRALIRLTIPLRKFCFDIEKALHLELYHGNGRLYMRTFKGLRDKCLSVNDDPYISALDFDLPDKAGDREIASQVLLLANQLLSYLEAETGISGIVGATNSIEIQTAPYVIVNASKTSEENQRRVMETVNRLLNEEDEH